MICEYQIEHRYGLTYVPCNTFARKVIVGDEWNGNRKPWRRRFFEGRYQHFQGLIVMKLTVFGTALYRSTGDGPEFVEDWMVLNMRKPINLGWKQYR